MATSPIATAADYADAMMVARRAKNWLFLLILVAVLGQLAMFFALRYRPGLIGASAAVITTDTAAAPVTQPHRISLSTLFENLVAVTGFIGFALTVVLALVQLLIVTIMLVGRLIGISKVTSAFIWCLVLIVLMFPWQSFLASPVASSGTSPEFKIPGVLYTWSEVTHPTLGATFNTATPLAATLAYLRWARFVIWPIVAIIFLLVIQSQSSRGLRMALGEVDFDHSEGRLAA